MNAKSKMNDFNLLQVLLTLDPDPGSSHVGNILYSRMSRHVCHVCASVRVCACVGGVCLFSGG